MEQMQTAAQQLARGLIRGYFAMLTQGCGQPACPNQLCASGVHKAGGVRAALPLDRANAAKLAVALAQTADRYLCVAVDGCDQCGGGGAAMETSAPCPRCGGAETPAAMPGSICALLPEAAREQLPALAAAQESAPADAPAEPQPEPPEPVPEREPSPEPEAKKARAAPKPIAASPPEGTAVLELDAVQAHCEAVAAGGGEEALAKLVSLVSQTFADSNALNFSFLLKDGRDAPTRESSSLDFAAIAQFYEAVAAHPAAQEALMESMGTLVNNVRLVAGFFEADACVDLRQFLVCACCPLLEDPSYHEKHMRRLTQCVGGLPNGVRSTLAKWMAELPVHMFAQQVQSIQMYITCHITGIVMDEDEQRGQIRQQDIFPAIRMLQLMHTANEQMQPPLGYKDFYNDAINEFIDHKESYIRAFEDRQQRQAAGREQQHFCDYPFILNAVSKSRIFQTDGRINMHQAQRNGAMASIMQGQGFMPYLVVKVRRDHLVTDAVRQFDRSSEELKKPLKVQFVGEDGVDEGGVKKEFFQLIVPMLLNEDYGMFTCCDDEARKLWISNFPHWQAHQFALIGKIIGVAIYNGVILDLRFPKLFWRKLRGGTAECKTTAVTLTDLEDVQPTISKSMKELLTFEGDVEETFCLNFTISLDSVIEGLKTMELKPGGEGIAVTAENREEYVQLYLEHLLNVAPQGQLSHLVEGFSKVCGGDALALCLPEELELITIGIPDLDFASFQRGALYQDGYAATDAAVQWFWQVAGEMDDDGKKRLLSFATGSDRVPVGGLENLHLVISKQDSDEDARLPSAHTCFNHLLLPEYSSYDILKARLETAITETKGFGLL